MPKICTRRVWISMTNKTYRRLRNTVSTCTKSHAKMPAACDVRNCRQVGDARRSAGPRPAAARIRRMVPSPIRCPRPSSSPRMRRCPHRGFSRANRTTKPRSSSGMGGRPTGLGYVQRLVTSRRCQVNKVPGVTIRWSRSRLGNSRASAASSARSAQSSLGRTTCRRSTATSCRSTSISTSLEASLRVRSTNQPNNRTISRYTRRMNTSAEHRRPGQVPQTSYGTAQGAHRRQAQVPGHQRDRRRRLHQRRPARGRRPPQRPVTWLSGSARHRSGPGCPGR
jgi:hypothetical protein